MKQKKSIHNEKHLEIRVDLIQAEVKTQLSAGVT
jgi:hypothetical protein